MCCILHVYICKPQNTNTQATPLFRYEPFINFLNSVVRHEERQFLKVFRIILCKQHVAGIQLYVPMAGTQRSSSMVQPQNTNCLVGLQLLNIIFRPQLQLSTSMADNPTVCLHSPKSTPNWRVFQNPQILSLSLRAWYHSHSSPISYLGFIMTIVIVISFALERKLYPMLCTWTKSQIVQSPTKLNDKL